MENTPRPGLLAVTKKIIMAITGLGLCLFLVGHLAGNTLLLMPGANGRFDWFNTYAGTLNKIPILPIVELGLLAMFLLHAYEGFSVWQQNKAARPVDYQGGKTWAKAKSSKSKKSASSTMMMWTGTVILLFVAMHVWQMKYHHSIGPENPVSAVQAGETAQPVVMTAPSVEPGETPAEAQAWTKTLAAHVIYEFKKPYVSLIYMFCMVVLGMHLYHAVWSSFQTLGATDTKLRRYMFGFGKAFTVIVAGGFFILPLWAWFFVEVPK